MSNSVSGRPVYIVECVRTPIGVGRKSGALHNEHPVDLLAQTLREVTKRAGVDPSHVEDVVAGCVTPIGKQGANVARLAALAAGFPNTVPGVQLNRMCGSGQQAVHFVSQAIAAGDMDMGIACGVEMMSVVKMGSDSDALTTKKDLEGVKLPFRLLHQGVSAELIADKWNIDRKEMDALAAESHRRASEAAKRGAHKAEIMPVVVKDKDGSTRVFDADEGVKYPVNHAKVASLRPIFRKQGGRVTAANASQISDGAAAILLCSGPKAEELGLKRRARVIGRVVVGSDPELMLTAPIPATKQVLQRTGLTLDQIDAVEINEAFASVVLAWKREYEPDMSRVNPNGGAMAHGHPLGATGAVLMTKLVHHLEATGGRYGLQTMCIGHGQGTATVIENMSYPRSKL